jgi:hypothetical protein
MKMLPGWLCCGFLLFLASGPALAEPECRPAAVIEGPEGIRGPVQELLAARGVAGRLMPGCPAIRVQIAAVDGGFEVALQDPSGRAGAFRVVGATTAAALIEAWASAALQPLLPLGAPELFGGEPAGAAPSRPPREHRIGLQAGLRALVSPVGTQLGAGAGIQLRAGALRFSAEGNLYDFGSSSVSEAVISDGGPSGPPLSVVSEELRSVREGLLRVGIPVARGRLTFTPSVAAGLSAVISDVDTVREVALSDTQTILEPSSETFSTTGFRAEGQAELAIALRGPIRLQLAGALGLAGSNTSERSDRGLFGSSAPTARIYSRLSVGVAFR